MIMLKSTMRLALIVVLAFVLGCEDNGRFDSIKAPVLLIGDISSYQSIDAFKISLRAAYSWEVLPSERSSFRGDKYRPAFEVESLLVRDFSHLGQRGNLLIIFFNNRLAKTLFFPSDQDKYLIALSFDIDHDVLSSEEFFVRPHVRIWAATDGQGKNYVGWEDRRLADEMARWIKKYA